MIRRKQRSQRGANPLLLGDPPSGRRGAREDQEAAAASSPRRSSSLREQIPKPAPPPQVKRSAKRTSVTQEVPLTSPVRQHLVSKSRTMLSELKISGVRTVTPKASGEEWCQAMFAVMLEKKRVQLKTNKDMWLSGDYKMLMSNMQETIQQRATELQIDLDSLSEGVLMSK